MSSKLTNWAELIYSEAFPLSLSWPIRVMEAHKKLGYALTEEEQRRASNAYFENHAQARAFWSLTRLYQNVCQSVEELEGTSDGKNNENQSYKTKIENGMKLPVIWKQIEEEREKIFKKNNQAEFDFRSGKAESSFKKSEADHSMNRLKAKHGNV